MAWLRIDDTVPHHQKFLRAGADAAWLWVCAVAYCQRHLSDGFVPTEAVAFLGVPKGAARLMETLCDVRLMEREEGGYRVHDYHSHNATREEALAQRVAVSERRAAAGRMGGIRSGISRRSNEANLKQLASKQRSKEEAPSRPDLNTPLTPLSGGPSKPKRAELQTAKDVLRIRFGACKHDPPCGNRQRCLVAIVEEIRAKAASA